MARLQVHRGGDDHDPRVTAVLREVYAAPQAREYWESLQTRVMARLDEAAIDGSDWWTVLSGWGRMGLVAAGVAALIAGVATVQSQRAAAADAYAVVDEPSNPTLQTALVEPGALSAGTDSSLRYIISY